MKAKILNNVVKYTLALAFYFSFFSMQVNAGDEVQETKDTISVKAYSGKVLDKETKKPVVFANVYVSETGLGTVTNSEGEFVLKVPSSLAGKKLAVTFIGYKNYTVALSEVKAEENTIYLEPSPVPIDEVIIRTGDPLKLVQNAINNIKYNYLEKPEKEIGFYRETIKQNRNYIEVGEAVLDVYKASYSNDVDFDRVKIYKGRKSHDVKKMDTVLFKFQGGPKTSVLLDMAKNPGNLLSNDMLEYYDFSIAGMININDRETYVIDFDQKDNVQYPLYKGKLFLDVKTLAITGVEFKLSDKGIDLAGNELIRKKPASMDLVVDNGNYLVNYRESNGKWFLSYVRSEIVFKCKWDKKLFRSTYTTTFEMAVTDRQTDNVNKIKYSEAAKLTDVFASQVSHFSDDNFWGDYNYIKPDESIEIAISKLNKKLKVRE